jgi:hypothetical protein
MKALYIPYLFLAFIVGIPASMLVAAFIAFEQAKEYRPLRGSGPIWTTADLLWQLCATLPALVAICVLFVPTLIFVVLFEGTWAAGVIAGLVESSDGRLRSMARRYL